MTSFINIPIYNCHNEFYPFFFYVTICTILILTLTTWKSYESRNIQLAIRSFFSIWLVIFIYLVFQGRCFFSEEFYPHVVSELGFALFTLLIIDHFRSLFKKREDELKKEIDFRENIASKQPNKLEEEIDIGEDNTDEANVRKVIRAILSSPYSYRTIRGISKDTKLSEMKVKEILEFLLGQKYTEKRKNKEGIDVWRIDNRRSG